MAKAHRGSDKLQQEPWAEVPCDDLKKGRIVGLLAALQARRQMRGSREVCRLHRQEPQPHALSRVPPTGPCVGSGMVESGRHLLVGRLNRSGMYYRTVDGANDILPLHCCVLSGNLRGLLGDQAENACVQPAIHVVLLVCHESAEASEGSTAAMLRKGWGRPQAVVQAEAPNHPLLLHTRGAVVLASWEKAGRGPVR